MEIKRIYIAKEDVKPLFEDDMIVELPVRHTGARVEQMWYH